jgi:hypothetical protein
MKIAHRRPKWYRAALTCALIIAVSACGTAVPAHAATTKHHSAACTVIHERSGEWYLKLVIRSGREVTVTVRDARGELLGRRALPLPPIPSGQTLVLWYDYAGRYASPVPVSCSYARD